MYAVCLGLVAAAVFGAASVLEEGSTKQVQQRAALSPRLLADLVRRPLFLAAIGMNAAGAGMQILRCISGRSRWFSRCWCSACCLPW